MPEPIIVPTTIAMLIQLPRRFDGGGAASGWVGASSVMAGHFALERALGNLAAPA